MKKLLRKILTKLLNHTFPPKLREDGDDPLLIYKNQSCKFNGSSIKIGNNCYLSNCSIENYTYLSNNVSMMNTEIGKFCSIAQGVCVCLGRHPTSGFVSTSPTFFSLSKQNGLTFSDKNYFEEMGKVTIGNDVWLGVNCVVLDDVIIGNGAIVGAGAVVTKDVPAYSIVAGVPAKIIRYRFQKDEIEFLERFKWWDKDVEWLQTHYKDLHNIKEFIEKHNHPGC